VKKLEGKRGVGLKRGRKPDPEREELGTAASLTRLGIAGDAVMEAVGSLRSGNDALARSIVDYFVREKHRAEAAALLLEIAQILDEFPGMESAPKLQIMSDEQFNSPEATRQREAQVTAAAKLHSIEKMMNPNRVSSAANAAMAGEPLKPRGHEKDAMDQIKRRHGGDEDKVHEAWLMYCRQQQRRKARVDRIKHAMDEERPFWKWLAEKRDKDITDELEDEDLLPPDDVEFPRRYREDDPRPKGKKHKK